MLLLLIFRGTIVSICKAKFGLLILMFWLVHSISIGFQGELLECIFHILVCQILFISLIGLCIVALIRILGDS